MESFGIFCWPILILHLIVRFKLRLSRLKEYKHYFSLRNPLIILGQNLKQFVLVFFLFSRKFLFISTLCCSHSNFFNALRFVIPYIFQIIAFKHIRSLYYFWWSWKRPILNFFGIFDKGVLNRIKVGSKRV